LRSAKVHFIRFLSSIAFDFRNAGGVTAATHQGSNAILRVFSAGARP
jgi:hypothetical protein